MTYKGLLESVCGKRRASLYIKGVEEAGLDLKQSDGKELSEDDVGKILKNLKDTAGYTVQNELSIGAMVMAVLALVVSVSNVLIQKLF